MAKTTTNERKPMEVSVNLNTMREQVQRGMLDGIRATLKVFDDIDAAERVLAAHATGTFPHGLLAFHSGNGVAPTMHTSNGNGTGAHRGEELKALPKAKRTYNVQRNKGNDVFEQCLRELAALGTDVQMTSTGLIERLRVAGLIPRELNEHKASSYLLAVLRRKQDSGYLEGTRGRGPGVHKSYRITPEGLAFITARGPRTEAPEPTVMPAPTPQIEEPLGDPISPDTSLRPALIEVMIRAKRPISVGEAADTLYRHGWPVKRFKSKLTDHLHQMFVALTGRSITKRMHKAKGQPVRYKLNRPAAVRLLKAN